MKKLKHVLNFLILCFLIFGFFFLNHVSSSTEQDKFKTSDCFLKVHYLDVGQGDSIFIELPNHEVMLIDAAEANMGSTITNYIQQLGYQKIDYVVGTHPHTDHIGGMAEILQNFEIGKLYMPKAISTSKTYENLLTVIKEKGLKIQTAKAGVNILNHNDLTIDILAPNQESYSNLNNYSAVLKITYQQRTFLFMGDAEAMSESEIMEDVKADVIKIGHHGSETSSSQNFVNKVDAEYGIISVGANNSYHHPSQTILDRFEQVGTKIYRTDLNGTIIITTDGNDIHVNITKGE